MPPRTAAGRCKPAIAISRPFGVGATSSCWDGWTGADLHGRRPPGTAPLLSWAAAAAGGEGLVPWFLLAGERRERRGSIGSSRASKRRGSALGPQDLVLQTLPGCLGMPGDSEWGRRS
uniref:Uncharacterized protein n=1 Tax=Setaria viridis TaxID=4556 RepID=A0A4U6UV47_SETVI|nr:hypothetical protein SEVIR_5G437933v2 [Setaria viridis]